MSDGPILPEERTEMLVPRQWRLWFLVVPGALYVAVPATPFSPKKSATPQNTTSAATTSPAQSPTFCAVVSGKEVISRYPSLLDPRAWFRGG